MIVLALLVAAASETGAHDGPPYAVVVDHACGPYTLSVWADPDVGTGTFYVYLEPSGAKSLPESASVEIFVRPADGRSPEVRYPAARSPEARTDRQRYLGLVKFDTEGAWSVRVAVHAPGGGGEVATDVAVTPPGQGPVLDFVLYLFPFVAVGSLFLLAFLRRRTAPRRDSVGGSP